MKKHRADLRDNKLYYPLIRKCNNNCISCVDNKSMAAREETFEEILETLNSVKEIETVVLSCGEPTIRPDFFKILDAICIYNFKIHLLSNGRLFAKKSFTESMRKYKTNNTKISISVYGHNAKLHDRITRVDGSFQETVRGIKNLLAVGFVPELRILINKINYNYLPKTAKYIIKTFPEISKIILIFPFLQGNAAWNRDEVHISYSQSMPKIEETVDILVGKYRISLLQFPKCVLNKNYSKYAAGYSAPNKYMVEYFKFCEKCKERKNCSGVWANYKLAEGIKELHPI